MYISIVGNIGVGKSTLARLLGRHYKWEVMYEAVENNPYLADFYEDMARWSFHLQMFFLKSRFEQVLEIEQSNKRFIQDRTIYEDAFIFAKNLHDSGNLTDTDYQTYGDYFNLMLKFVKPPDLLIYLKADVPKLVNQIKMRGRDFEANIPLEYLQDLNKHYTSFIENFKDCRILTIDVNNKDFLNNNAHFQEIIEGIDRALIYGQ